MAGNLAAANSKDWAHGSRRFQKPTPQNRNSENRSGRIESRWIGGIKVGSSNAGESNAGGSRQAGIGFLQSKSPAKGEFPSTSCPMCRHPFAAPAPADGKKGSAAEIAKPALASAEKSPPATADKSADTEASIGRRRPGNRGRGEAGRPEQESSQEHGIDQGRAGPILRASPHVEPPGAAAPRPRLLLRRARPPVRSLLRPRPQGRRTAITLTATYRQRLPARRPARAGSPATGRGARLKLLYETDSAQPPSKAAENKPPAKTAAKTLERFEAARHGTELLGDRGAGPIQPKLPAAQSKGAAAGANEQSAAFAAQRSAGGRELAAPRMQAIFVFRRAAPVAE